MSLVSWGKPRIFIKNLNAVSAKWEEMPTPVEDSTTLETSEGDTLEAKVEGGEYEDVMHKAATYTLTVQVRLTKGRKQPIEDADGVITDNYAIIVQPQDAACEGFGFDKSSVGATLDYTAGDGLSITYTFTALKPTTGSQCKHGVVTVTESEGVISNVALA